MSMAGKCCEICTAEDVLVVPVGELQNDFMYLLGESMTEECPLWMCTACCELTHQAADFVRQCRVAFYRSKILLKLVKEEVAVKIAESESEEPEPAVEDPVLQSSDEEKPLLLLKIERCTQKSMDKEMERQTLLKTKKRKRKRKKLVASNKDSLDSYNRDSRKTKTNDQASVASVKCKKEGRRVVETEEYVVIRLTHEQIVSEMNRTAESEQYASYQYKCKECVKGFNYEDVWRLHREKHSPKSGWLACDICGQYCPSAVSLRGHMKSHSTRYACKSCDAVRRSRQHLLEHHALAHAGAAPHYTCIKCGLTTVKRTMFQKHMRSHAPTAPLACDSCGKLFKSIETLRAHMLRHVESARHACALCPRRYAHAAELRQHMCAHVARDHYCVECDVRFRSRSSLNAHLRRSKAHVSSNGPQHACGVCNKWFGTAAALAAHTAWAHEGRREYACRACSRTYGTRDGLRAHARRAHEGRKADKLHACSYCSKTFRARGVLVKHVRVHTGERPYECGECGHKFAQSSTCTTHIRLVHQKVSRRAPPSLRVSAGAETTPAVAAHLSGNTTKCEPLC